MPDFAALDTPAQMTFRERLLLYAFAVARRPARVLEIGTCEGGSALILRRALGAEPLIVCIDPAPRWSEETRRELGARTQLLTTRSPGAIAAAATIAGGPFDLVLVDGDHTTEGVAADLHGVVPHLAAGAHLLLHDAHYWRVRDGIDRVLGEVPSLRDAGLLSTEQTIADRHEEGHPVIWGGLRLLYHHDTSPGLP
ncbi:O-methyltransferase [Luteitalea sp. TBR-22]|uniref:O-methyltransferase n=1 Tax=Luteitalea sp. TBR-22 TaxID=2802971 RepID=UPI001EF3EEE0|nr:class I SAM-dependent methyltransferase [Luteitalea sp. TBR-22]